ncbi:hypothetical protein GQR58_029684 [Nymphon striatum]|nr:hypothetical protein GQR58_029684 [Nymphon striatum]
MVETAAILNQADDRALRTHEPVLQLVAFGTQLVHLQLFIINLCVLICKFLCHRFFDVIQKFVLVWLCHFFTFSCGRTPVYQQAVPYNSRLERCLGVCPGRRRKQPIFNMTIRKHQNNQRPFRRNTNDAPWVTPDSAAPTRSSNPPTSEASLPAVASIFSRSVSAGSPSSIIPSTNIRKPNCVGIRPALTCGEPSTPMYSKSCITLRIVAALTFSLKSRVNVREPTGSPFAR